MIKRTLHTKPPENLQRRKVLQGAAAASMAVAAPALTADTVHSSTAADLSGKLVCNIANPVKTLLICNHTNKTVVLDHISKGALMFDGSIVDCNNAFLDQAVSVPANDEIEIRFSKLHAHAISHKMNDFQRIQSRVKRLADGTRVIPFTAVLQDGGAVFA